MKNSKHLTIWLKSFFVLLITLPFLFNSCEKDNSNNFLYTSLKNSNEESFNFVENQGSFLSSPTYSSSPPYNTFTFGCSIYDESEYLRGTWNEYLNRIEISFRNISFEEIQIGDYDYYNNIIGLDTISKGIEITWMTSSDWEKIMIEYRKTESYLNCMSRDDFEDMYSVCNEYSRGYHDFYNSSNTIQNNSYFKITNMYSKQYEVWNPDCFPNEFFIDGIIIEGKFKCDLKSKLADIKTETLSGTFRLHIANYPQRNLCGS